MGIVKTEYEWLEIIKDMLPQGHKEIINVHRTRLNHLPYRIKNIILRLENDLRQFKEIDEFLKHFKEKTDGKN